MGEEINKKLNAAYINAVNTWAGQESASSSRVVFPCIQGSQAILAGRGVADSRTNNDLISKADNLLTSTSVWCDFGAKGSYSQLLSRYLDFVTFPNAGVAAENYRDEKQQDFNKVNQIFLELDEAAYEKYEASTRKDKGDYTVWLLRYGRNVAEADLTVKDAQKTLSQARIAIGLPGAELLDKYKTSFSKINNKASAVNEAMLTMPISGGQVYDIETYIEKLRKGVSERAPNPPGVAYVPHYDLDGNYASTMDDWYKNFPTEAFSNEVTFSSEEGSESSVINSGHEVENVRESLGYGWLRTSHSTGEQKVWSDTKALSNNAKVTIKLSCKQKKVFSVNPGKTWDVPAYRQLFPNTKDGLVPAAKNLVQPTGMLCVSGLRLSAQFDSAAKEIFDSEFKQAKDTSGFISFFGIAIDANSSAEVSRKQTHAVSWDKDTGTLSFEPTSYVGNCTLLAMIGSRTNIV